MQHTPPDEPAGPFQPLPIFNEAHKLTLVAALQQAPALLRSAVDGLTATQLDTLYKNWSLRQIVHHMADSHVHSYLRFKWTLAEDSPTIKAYEEDVWVRLPDSASGQVAPALLMLAGIHAKWGQVLHSMSPAQFERQFLHPQTGKAISLWTALNYYVWHSRHHTAQIQWVRSEQNWLS